MWDERRRTEARRGDVPGWLVALAILFWGGVAGRLPLALPLALAAVGSRFIARRFELSPIEFHRAFDVAWVLLAGGLLLIYNRESVGNVLRGFVQWLPLFLFPCVLAQLWSVQGRVPLSALLPVPRWRRHRARVDPRIDVVPPYVAICLLSASAAGGGNPWFYAGFLAIVGTALWIRRFRGVPAWAAGATLLAAAAGGWWVAGGIAGFQTWLEERVIAWATQMRRDDGAGRVSRTAIGETGRVRGSSRIVLKVRQDGEGDVPTLLRLATFSAWQERTWYAPRTRFEKVDGTADEWVLDPRPGRTGSVQIELARAGTAGLLPLPTTTRVVGNVPAVVVERSESGAVRAELRAGVIGYRADFAPDAAWEAPPAEDDRDGVPSAERSAISAVASELGLKQLPPGEVLQRLEEFFQSSFRYSTDLKDPPVADPRATTPVGRFLLGTREGHCEYFATAAVLLLRAAGVPARYATGFLVAREEHDGRGYTVREAHAHAWVRVWSDGRWSDFDPTPSRVQVEARTSQGWVERLRRSWYGLRFGLARWWWLGEKRLLRQAYWLTVPVLALLVWRLRSLRATQPRDSRRSPALEAVALPGADSEWFAVQSLLAERGWHRVDGEPAAAWGRRLLSRGWDAGLAALTARALRLHERLRFDPVGLGSDERVALRHASEELLSRTPTSIPEISARAEVPAAFPSPSSGPGTGTCPP